MRKGQMFKFGKYIYLLLFIVTLVMGCGNRNSALTNPPNDSSSTSSESSDASQEVAVIPVDTRIETDRSSQDADNANEDIEADITENTESDTNPEIEEVKVEEYGSEIWNHIHELLSGQDLDRGNRRGTILCQLGTEICVEDKMFTVTDNALCEFESFYEYEDEHKDFYTTYTPIVNGDIWNLNYIDGDLYYTSFQASNGTVLIRSALDGSSAVALHNFGDRIKQLYFLSDNEFLYLQGNSIYYHNLLNDTDCVIFRHEDIYSFVPTKAGIIYALGEANRYTVYMEDMVIVPYCDYYTARIEEDCEYLRLSIIGKVIHIKTEDIRTYLEDNSSYDNSGYRVESPMQYKGEAYDADEMGMTVDMYEVLFPDGYFDEVMEEYTEKNFGQEWENERREYINSLLYDCTDLDKANTRDEILNNKGITLNTDDSSYYSNSEGLFLKNSDSDRMIQYSDVWNLNYIDNKLYYTISYCDFVGLFATDVDGNDIDPNMYFNYKIKQLYFIGETDILYLDNRGIHYQSFGGEGYFALVINDDLYSFVPSKHGVIYAVGNEADFSLYMEDTLIAGNCDYYTIYNQDGTEYLQYNSKGETIIVKTEDMTDNH